MCDGLKEAEETVIYIHKRIWVEVVKVLVVS